MGDIACRVMVGPDGLGGFFQRQCFYDSKYKLIRMIFFHVHLMDLGLMQISLEKRFRASFIMSVLNISLAVPTELLPSAQRVS